MRAITPVTPPNSTYRESTKWEDRRERVRKQHRSANSQIIGQDAPRGTGKAFCRITHYRCCALFSTFWHSTCFLLCSVSGGGTQPSICQATLSPEHHPTVAAHPYLNCTCLSKISFSLSRAAFQAHLDRLRIWKDALSFFLDHRSASAIP